jgi:3'(2'), 5'-bisphosphate nucleotidase
MTGGHTGIRTTIHQAPSSKPPDIPVDPISKMTSDYAEELLLANLAVQRAVIATKKVRSWIADSVLAKEDKSTVSVADFAVQALLIGAIHSKFPEDVFIAEEDTKDLRGKVDLVEQVWNLVQSTHLNDPQSEAQLYSPKSKEEMLDLIDIGGSLGVGEQYSSSKRVWVIDPIDGTQTYLEGGQYVVVLSMLDGGEQKIAAFGCPQVALDTQISDNEVHPTRGGHLISAVKDHGAWIRPLTDGILKEASKVQKRVEKIQQIRWIESSQRQSLYFPHRNEIAHKVGAQWPPLHLFSTQMKYVALSLATTDCYLRLPKARERNYPHIWDHAGGMLIAEEAGCTVTDIDGNKIDVAAGRDLTNNFGVVAAPSSVHSKILEATQEVYKAYGHIVS